MLSDWLNCSECRSNYRSGRRHPSSPLSPPLWPIHSCWAIGWIALNVAHITGLVAGTPQVLCPLHFDQFIHAKRLVELLWMSLILQVWSQAPLKSSVPFTLTSSSMLSAWGLRPWTLPHLLYQRTCWMSRWDSRGKSTLTVRNHSPRVLYCETAIVKKRGRQAYSQVALPAAKPTTRLHSLPACLHV
jgi:hypothetical protein